MRSIVTFAAIASFAMANAIPAEPPVTIHYPEADGNHTLEARDPPPWPGYLQCKQGRFKLPCTWTATGGNGAMDCHKLMYAEGQKNPGTSFGPDKGVTCRFYDSSDCAQGGKPLNVIWPGGDLLQLGRDAGSFPQDSVEGFWSFRCRSWQQADNDAAQSKYIKLPEKPPPVDSREKELNNPAPQRFWKGY